MSFQESRRSSVLGRAGWLMGTGPIGASADSSPDIRGAQMAVLGRNDECGLLLLAGCRASVEC